MKLLIGLVLVATAFSYPLGESEEKPHDPLVISDSYSSVSKSEEAKHELTKTLQHDASSDSSSSSSEESSESGEAKPSEAPAAISEETPEKPALDQPQAGIALKESHSDPAHASEAIPAAQEPQLKTGGEIKPAEPAPIEEKKPEEALPTLKKVESEVSPQIKAAEPEKHIEQPQQEPIKAEEAPLVKSHIEEHIEEKPLALPTHTEEHHETKTAAASEIQEDIIALPSEQKVEVPAAVEEKIPELKTTAIEPEKIEQPIEKKAKSEEGSAQDNAVHDSVVPHAPEVVPSEVHHPIQEDSVSQDSPASEAPQQTTEEPQQASEQPSEQPQAASEQPQAIADQVASDARPHEEEKPFEKQPEGKSAVAVPESSKPSHDDAVSHVAEEIKPEHAVVEEHKATENAASS
ncbi:probable serine/threonine-protein kinase kinX [Sitophilus oryzae]|uniref:Probable serine/threonine-protein kinase kinX n=1 Tax=Sitophilus oryzae TaxID=7048 RepID=A0A6J2Y485_SITOR|nr:probable serine/threonine-protein kinase kinX [Sitophilus oryzae]